MAYIFWVIKALFSHILKIMFEKMHPQKLAFYLIDTQDK